MKPEAKAVAIVASVLIVVFCLVYALTLTSPGGFKSEDVDISGEAALEPGDRLEIRSEICGVTVTADPAASKVSARLHGSYKALAADKPELTVTRSGGAVTVRAGRKGSLFLNWWSGMTLEVVIPAAFRGEFDCESSAGAVLVQADLTVRSFRAHSSAGKVAARGIRAEGHVEVSSSAGSVETGAVEAASAEIQTSAGRVSVESCRAATIEIHSSAGGVTANGLSGKITASSSAGSVEVTLLDIAAEADIWSSAGSVRVAVPAGAGANLKAWSSAGGVDTAGLTFTDQSVAKRNRIEARLNGGGPEVKIHSSAGSVNVVGK